MILPSTRCFKRRLQTFENLIFFFMLDFEGNTKVADDSRLVNSSFKPHRLLNSSNLKCNLVNLWEF